MSALDLVAAFVRVVSSSLKGGEPVFNVAAIGDFDEDADADPNKGETATEQLAHGALGLIARPLDPDADGFAEALALRLDSKLEPLGWRDLRLNALLGGAAPSKGQQMLAGYGGAFLSHSMTAANSGSRKANISVWYVPHDFSGTTPSKAHAIIVDPTPGNSNITIVHANGTRFTLADETGTGPGLLASVNGTTFLRMTDGEFSVSAERILLQGNVYLGRDITAAIPFAGGPTMPPSSSVFLTTP